MPNLFLTQSSFARERQRVIARMLQDRAYETYRFNIQLDMVHADMNQRTQLLDQH